MNWELIGQAALAILLMLTIGYCAVLERRLRGIRSAHEEMSTLLAEFGKATGQAERGIDKLRITAQDISSGLQDDMDRAVRLRDELHVITQSGNTLAEKLERGLMRRDRQSPSAQQQQPQPPAPAATARDDEPVSESERELMKALRQVS